ncbi:energy-coupling factor transport system ATP-binding protein [Terribacillus aidingensis]|uniref:Energy-coupling factor transporter ATP-binding protein EcfA2 n=1 Tax=Terribacillus aidingensis TaxID=586416 RepID=A0A285P9R3_9BACI|nr:energy-coupling factor ABC transporter ATP-binding protein [Terribacillus aidingensis]SNZ17933.1 energy-coupling factor transport system ATP-binding protein [Terribacillus aidingensis]
MDITFEKVDYTYQANSPFEHKALDSMSFHLPSGSFTAIVGHTGSGKSTLIQHLNGLIRPTNGKVRIGDYVLEPKKKPKHAKALREKVGIVFQYPEHQLFEETVEKDIAFGPRNFGVPEQEIQKRVAESARAVGLGEDLLKRSPFELSGGQMRRVAIAGILAVRPRVLVLDEPTAGLDPRGQKEIMDMFYRIHKEQQLTTLLVTHSMEDALAYADHVLVLDKGKKYMEGTPVEVFSQREALQQVQLDVPEMFQFLLKASDQFGKPLAYQGQDVERLAEQLAALAGDRDE